MIPTLGLTHIQLLVHELERSARFYRSVFGMEEISRTERMILLRTPGAHDTIALAETSERFTPRGGVDHFGFHLVDKDDLDAAIRSAEAAGGNLVDQGVRPWGNRYAYVADPDGHAIEF